MRDYEICFPDKEEWCVPAALQTILNRRRIYLSQEEITRSFPEYLEESTFKGFEFSRELLERFFSEHRLELRCLFRNPFKDFDLHQNVDLFLNRLRQSQLHGDSQDLLVAYDFHVGVFLDYLGESDLVRITGIGENPSEEVPLPLIVRGMHPDKNENYGFYIIS